MASTKRERQRANREVGKQQVEETDEKVEQKQSLVKFAIIGAVIVAALLIWVLISRGGGDNSVTLSAEGRGTSAELESWNQDAGSMDPVLRTGIYSEPSPMVLEPTRKSYEAVIETANGDMRFELFAEVAPITVNNFVNLANDGFYDGLTFQRVLEDFMAQGGDPAGTGSGGPGYRFDNEYTEGIEFDKRGQLAMANAGVDTNGSQFFITFTGENGLPASQYTIFGQLLSGDDALSAISLRDPNGGGPPGDVIKRVTIEISEDA